MKDVQLHPVKMLIFIRFAEDKFRDEVLAKIQAGVVWRDYKVKVKGYSLDSKVKFIRLLGVSPETGSAEIKKVFEDLGIGNVIEIKKGLLDSARLPGVTNGTWNIRVKIFIRKRPFPHTYIAGMRGNCGPSILRDEYFVAGSVGVGPTLEINAEIRQRPSRRSLTAVLVMKILKNLHGLQ